MNEVGYDAPRPESVRDLSETLAAQQTGGNPAQTEALAQSFLARMQRDIDEQVDLRVQQSLAAWQGPKPATSKQQMDYAMSMALGSLGIGVPLSGVAVFAGGIWGLIVVWAGLVIINVAWSQRR